MDSLSSTQCLFGLVKKKCKIIKHNYFVHCYLHLKSYSDGMHHLSNLEVSSSNNCSQDGDLEIVMFFKWLWKTCKVVPLKPWFQSSKQQPKKSVPVRVQGKDKHSCICHQLCSVCEQLGVVGGGVMCGFSAEMVGLKISVISFKIYILTWKWNVQLTKSPTSNPLSPISPTMS